MPNIFVGCAPPPRTLASLFPPNNQQQSGQLEKSRSAYEKAAQSQEKIGSAWHAAKHLEACGALSRELAELPQVADFSRQAAQLYGVCDIVAANPLHVRIAEHQPYHMLPIVGAGAEQLPDAINRREECHVVCRHQAALKLFAVRPFDQMRTREHQSGQIDIPVVQDEPNRSD